MYWTSKIKISTITFQKKIMEYIMFQHKNNILRQKTVQ